jgi:hypothetical protein
MAHKYSHGILLQGTLPDWIMEMGRHEEYARCASEQATKGREHQNSWFAMSQYIQYYYHTKSKHPIMTHLTKHEVQFLHTQCETAHTVNLYNQ